jgi:hypothetical protein
MKTILVATAILSAMTPGSAVAQRAPGGGDAGGVHATASTRPGGIRTDEGRLAGPPPLPSRDQAIRQGLTPPSDAPGCPAAERDAEGRCVPRPR